MSASAVGTRWMRDATSSAMILASVGPRRGFLSLSSSSSSSSSALLNTVCLGLSAAVKPLFFTPVNPNAVCIFMGASPARGWNPLTDASGGAKPPTPFPWLLPFV